MEKSNIYLITLLLLSLILSSCNQTMDVKKGQIIELQSSKEVTNKNEILEIYEKDKYISSRFELNNIESITISDNASSGVNHQDNSSEKGYIPKDKMRLTLIKAKAPNGCYDFLLKAEWLTLPLVSSKDTIAFSWSNDHTILEETLDLYYSNGKIDRDKGALVGGTPNKSTGRVFDMTDPTGIVQKAYYSMRLSINGTSLSNVYGGYAHKTIGVGSVDIRVDGTGALSFSGGPTLKFDEMNIKTYFNN